MGWEQETEEHEELVHPLLLTKQQEEDRKLKEAKELVDIYGMDSTGFGFNAVCRPYRDTVFTFLFFGTVLMTYGIGLMEIRNADFDLYGKASSAKYNPDSGQCEVQGHASVNNSLTELVGLFYWKLGTKKENFVAQFVAEILVPILGTLVMTLPMGMFMLWLLHRYTRKVVLVTLPILIIFPYAIIAYWLTYCYAFEPQCPRILSTKNQIFMIILSCVLTITSAYRLYSSWGNINIDLTVQIFKTALQALRENLSLLLVNPILWWLAFLVNVPIVVFILCAQFNGKISPDFDRIKDPNQGCSQETGYPCCHVNPAPWVLSYYILACFASVWVILITFQLMTFVTSGTISQWYFAPAGSSTNIGTTKRSLRNAFGPSFGTACFSSLVVPFLEISSKVTNRQVNGNRRGIVAILFRSCFTWIFNFVGFYTSFTSFFVAISGESFYTSAIMASNLLRRNLLSPFIVDTQTSRVLAGLTIPFTFLTTLMSYGVQVLFTNEDTLVRFVGIIWCFNAVLLGLMVFKQVASVAISTIYVCYAMDKDVGAVSKPDIHDVYVLLPPSSSGD